MLLSSLVPVEAAGELRQIESDRQHVPQAACNYGVRRAANGWAKFESALSSSPVLITTNIEFYAHSSQFVQYSSIFFGTLKHGST